jgi:hypothetical protein
MMHVSVCLAALVISATEGSDVTSCEMAKNRSASSRTSEKVESWSRLQIVRNFVIFILAIIDPLSTKWFIVSESEK